MVLLSFLIKISIPALSTMPSQCRCLPTREHFVIVMQFCLHVFLLACILYILIDCIKILQKNIDGMCMFWMLMKSFKL